MTVPVSATPIDRLSVSDPDRTRFGHLLFRSGLELTSTVGGFGGFGGFSALRRSPDGRDPVAVADNAHRLQARMGTSEGRLSGPADAAVPPAPGSGKAPAQVAVRRWLSCDHRENVSDAMA